MAKGARSLTAPSKAVDPTLDALFSSSAGPVQAPSKSRYSELLEKKPRDVPPEPTADDEEGQDEEDDEVLSEISEELDYDDDDEDNEDGSEASSQEDDNNDDEDSSEDVDETMADIQVDVQVDLDSVIKEIETEQPKPDRKRKRKDDNDELEGKYLNKLAAEDDDEPAEKRSKKEQTDSDEESEDDGSDIPVHETLVKKSAANEDPDLEKAGRTVFLANVATEAVTSKTAKKTLLAHLSSVLDKDASPAQTIESIRFRSLAFAGSSMPKRASFITKNLMDATTKSANAYVVYSTAAAARTAATKLNGSLVLERHLRVDSVAHPSPTDHRRCVFVGNLGFVDDETVLHTNADGETKEKKRNKVPSDIEEGLWRTFGKVGRVENVRVIRDPKTRVGKGFAYVQFYDGNDVEAAVLLNEKKFPPMLPRALRVTRAKDPRKTALALERSRSKGNAATAPNKSMKHRPKATPEQQSMAGRAGRLLGRAGAAHQRHGKKPFRREPRHEEPTAPVIKTPEQVVFEGRRASSKDGKPKDLKFGKKGSKDAKSKNRSQRRAAEWKKSQKA